jgi:hypothetical protein
MAYSEFEFDLSEALLTRLVAVLNRMQPGPLTEANVTALPEGFDARYPINVDHALDFAVPTAGTVADCLAALKVGLPYVFRFETGPGSRRPHQDLVDAQMTLPDGPQTVRSILQTAITALPAAWQATALPSRVIIYRELDGYQYNTNEGGQLIARSG